jgi:hypothetical protein
MINNTSTNEAHYLAASHDICSSGLCFVSGFREFTRETRVSTSNCLAMSTTVITGRGVEAALCTIFTAFLFEQCLELPQLV